MEKVLTRNMEKPDSTSIDVYEAAGGYRAMRKTRRWADAVDLHRRAMRNIRSAGRARQTRYTVAELLQQQPCRPAVGDQVMQD